MRPDETELIRACLAGEEAAWRTLVLRYERLIYSIPLRYGMSTGEADDVFQNVCLALLQNLAAIRNPERLAKWVIVTTQRECWARWRRAARDEDPSASASTEPMAEDPETLILADEEIQTVLAALERLPARCQHLLRRLYLAPEPPTYQALAEELGMPVNSLGPTRARCLERLLTLVDDRVRSEYFPG